MQIQISGKQLDLGEALRVHVTERLEPTISKYFEKAVGAQVVFSHEGPLYRCSCKVHIGAGIDMAADATDSEIYESFNLALEKLAKQVRRDKRRRRNHHGQTHRVVAD